jgi:hypothetical protein
MVALNSSLCDGSSRAIRRLSSAAGRALQLLGRTIPRSGRPRSRSKSQSSPPPVATSSPIPAALPLPESPAPQLPRRTESRSINRCAPALRNSLLRTCHGPAMMPLSISGHGSGEGWACNSGLLPRHIGKSGTQVCVRFCAAWRCPTTPGSCRELMDHTHVPRMKLGGIGR